MQSAANLIEVQSAVNLIEVRERSLTAKIIKSPSGHVSLIMSLDISKVDFNRYKVCI